MLQMPNFQMQVQFLAQIYKQTQQRYRIRSSGDGDE